MQPTAEPCRPSYLEQPAGKRANLVIVALGHLAGARWRRGDGLRESMMRNTVRAGGKLSCLLPGARMLQRATLKKAHSVITLVAKPEARLTEAVGAPLKEAVVVCDGEGGRTSSVSIISTRSMHQEKSSHATSHEAQVNWTHPQRASNARGQRGLGHSTRGFVSLGGGRSHGAALGHGE